jgi:hypothetical protein
MSGAPIGCAFEIGKYVCRMPMYDYPACGPRPSVQNCSMLILVGCKRLVLQTDGRRTWDRSQGLLIQDRHFTKKLVPFIIRVPTAGYQAASLTLHHIRALARVLLFRQLNYLSGAACANEFSAICRFPSRKLNLCHVIILCLL